MPQTVSQNDDGVWTIRSIGQDFHLIPEKTFISCIKHEVYDDTRDDILVTQHDGSYTKLVFSPEYDFQIAWALFNKWMDDYPCQADPKDAYVMAKPPAKKKPGKSNEALLVEAFVESQKKPEPKPTKIIFGMVERVIDEE